VHDVNILDEIAIEAGAFSVMDRGYIDFDRLYRFTLESAFFDVRTKINVLLQRRYSRPVDKTTGLRSDHKVILTALGPASAYPGPLRRVTYCDPETGKRLKFLTNNFALPPLAIVEIYKKSWAMELFFRWIKQHPRIKAFCRRACAQTTDRSSPRVACWAGPKSTRLRSSISSSANRYRTGMWRASTAACAMNAST
jgi:IS4 transposase